MRPTFFFHFDRLSLLLSRRKKDFNREFSDLQICRAKMKQQILGLALLVMVSTVTAFKESDCEGKLLLRRDDDSFIRDA